jgi:hypothetical protein
VVLHALEGCPRRWRMHAAVRLTCGRVGAFVWGDLNEVVLDRCTAELPPTERPR